MRDIGETFSSSPTSGVNLSVSMATSRYSKVRDGVRVI